MFNYATYNGVPIITYGLIGLTASILGLVTLNPYILELKADGTQTTISDSIGLDKISMPELPSYLPGLNGLPQPFSGDELKDKPVPKDAEPEDKDKPNPDDEEPEDKDKLNPDDEEPEDEEPEYEEPEDEEPEDEEPEDDEYEEEEYKDDESTVMNPLRKPSGGRKTRNKRKNNRKTKRKK
jgi:hypothetical protein